MGSRQPGMSGPEIGPPRNAFTRWHHRTRVCFSMYCASPKKGRREGRIKWVEAHVRGEHLRFPRLADRHEGGTKTVVRPLIRPTSLSPPVQHVFKVIQPEPWWPMPRIVII